MALLVARNVIDDQAAVKAGLAHPSSSGIPPSGSGGGGIGGSGGGVSSVSSTGTDPPSLALPPKGGGATPTPTLPLNAAPSGSGGGNGTSTTPGIGSSTVGGAGRAISPLDKREWRWLWEYRNLLNKMQVFLGRAALDVELGKDSKG